MGMDSRWIRSFGRPQDVATTLLCRVCDHISCWCRIFSDLNWGTGQPSGSGTIIGLDIAV